MADSVERQDFSEPDTLVIEERFAIVPEWVLDADVSDCALRLYAVLLRYGQSSGARMPGRATLARRLRKKSTDTVDRAMKELVALGAVVVEHRYDGKRRLTNRYHVRSAGPGRANAATPPGSGGGGRTDAPRGGRTDAAPPGRSSAAGVAAGMRHNPEHLTQSTLTQTPPASSRPQPAPKPAQGSWEEEHEAFLAECGIDEWGGFVARCQRARRELGKPTGRWTAQCLLVALQTAVRARGWPATDAPRALLAIAADESTRSPMRVAEAGPWWDGAPPAGEAVPEEELATAETALQEAGGLRIILQREARKQLTAEGLPLTRGTVLRRAYALLAARSGGEAASC